MKTIQFQVTDNCNFNCSYCYQKNKDNNIMDFDIAKKTIDRVFTDNIGGYISTDTSFLYLSFIGGEPFLEIELIDKIVEYFKTKCKEYNHYWSNNFSIRITTNGSLLNNKIMDFIIRNKNCLELTISIDGDKSTHNKCRKFINGKNTYDIIIKNIKTLQEENIDYNLYMLVTKDNIKNLYNSVIELWKYTDFIKCKNTYENYIVTPEDALELFNQLKLVSDYIIDNNKLQKGLSFFNKEAYQPYTDMINCNHCGGANCHILGVSPDGGYYPCNGYMQSTSKDFVPYKIGDVENGIGYTPEQICRLNCLNNLTRRSQSTDECYYCPIASWCGYCSALNYETFGTINKRTTFNCLLHKAKSLANVYHFNRLYRKYGSDNRFHMWLPKEEALKIISETEYNYLYKLQLKNER